MRSTRRIAVAARLMAVVTVAMALSACDVVVSSLHATGKAQDQWTRTYTLAATGDVEIINANGGIDVVGYDGTQVEVVADRVARGMTDEDAKKVLQQLQIGEDVTANRVRLETRAATGEGRRVEVRYHVKVPASANLRLQNSNGAIDVVAVKGTVRAETSSGTVKGRDLTGSIEASTTNGAVRLEVTAIAPGGIRAETVNGSVELTMPTSAKADIQARCVNGRISVDGLKLDGGESTRRRVEGRLNGGGPKVVVDTTNGKIQITGK
jgi:hypothetical protein